ncbi:UNVERIFIED_CONTAM: hypothetical protein Sradi_6452000 [Sesamum radiatum]|uniref:DUF4218 domain-containing protein n=1 Tax=Sesamum radiatum TaxID=300843 RepID=A0AAW2K5B3_SESRA
MHGIKSHGCHVFIQKLILIAFHEMLPEPVWSTLIEVSYLFQTLCSMTLDVNKVRKSQGSVVTILCNLENIFLPAFFDSMEHMIVHLPYEAHMGRLLQYRWMYSFQRSFLNELYEHHHSDDPNIEDLVATEFKDWFKHRVDPMRGMKVHPRYHLVDVNFKKVYHKNKPFILAQQAVQVYYMKS